MTCAGANFRIPLSKVRGAGTTACKVHDHDHDVILNNGNGNGETWKILIVDDDPEIHSVTQLALSDLIVLGKNLE